MQTDPDAADHALFLYTEIETRRRQIEQLINDPSLGTAAVRANHLALYKVWKQWIDFAEARALPILERYSDEDRRMTRLCRELIANSSWPASLTPPIVGALSSEYYGSLLPFHIIYTPAAEGSGLLGIPDLCHEIAHLLARRELGALIGSFPSDLLSYFLDEKARVAAGQRPPAYGPKYDVAVREWAQRWLVEFVCDMVSAYVLGDSYGWQHLRLCAGGRNVAFVPSLGEQASHPADDARMRGIVAVLRGMGDDADADRLQTVWNEYLTVAGESKPTEFDLCYPATLIQALADQVRTACGALGLRPFTAAGSPDVEIPALLKEAWRRLREDPGAYRVWEEAQLSALWRRLGA
jgi:hypothetical protein